MKDGKVSCWSRKRILCDVNLRDDVICWLWFCFVPVCITTITFPRKLDHDEQINGVKHNLPRHFKCSTFIVLQRIVSIPAIQLMNLIVRDFILNPFQMLHCSCINFLTKCTVQIAAHFSRFPSEENLRNTICLQLKQLM